MTAAYSTRRPTAYQAPRVVLVEHTAWRTVDALVGTLGLTLEPVAAGPGQARRYRLAGPPPTGRARLLTDRELQVVGRMACGMSNGDIGRELHLSEDTVKTHASRLFRKLGARDRAHAVHLAHQAGLLTTTRGDA